MLWYHSDTRERCTRRIRLPRRGQIRLELREVAWHAEALDEEFVGESRLVARVKAVLVKDGDERPVLDAPEASDEASGAVLSHVAVYEQGSIGWVEYGSQGVYDDVCWYLFGGLLVPLDAVVYEIDVRFVEEGLIVVWVCFGAEAEYVSQLEVLQEGQVLARGEGRAVDARRHHGEVGRRLEELHRWREP